LYHKRKSANILCVINIAFDASVTGAEME